MDSFDFGSLGRVARRARLRRESEAREDKAIRYKNVTECKAIVDACQKRIDREVPRLADRYPICQLQRLHRIICEMEGSGRHVVHLPSLYMGQGPRRALLAGELQGYYNPHTLYIWTVYPALELKRFLHFICYGGCSRRIAAFNAFGDLVRQKLDPECYEENSKDLDAPWLDSKATLALCTVRLLEFIRKGRLIQLAAERIKERS